MVNLTKTKSVQAYTLSSCRRFQPSDELYLLSFNIISVSWFLAARQFFLAVTSRAVFFAAFTAYYCCGSAGSGCLEFYRNLYAKFLCYGKPARSILVPVAAR